MKRIPQIMAPRRYTVVIESGEQNLSAYFPDVPGCVAMGDSIEETLQLAKEALELHLEDELTIPTARTLPQILADELEVDETVLLLSWVDVTPIRLDEAA